MTKALDRMQARLAKSLRRTPRTIGRRTTTATATDTRRLVRNVTVSLNGDDEHRIGEIRRHMMDAGHCITASVAVKIALRCVRLDKALLSVYQEVEADDGRHHPRK